jgi:hypothetical protein
MAAFSCSSTSGALSWAAAETDGTALPARKKRATQEFCDQQKTTDVIATPLAWQAFLRLLQNSKLNLGRRRPSQPQTTPLTAKQVARFVGKG